MQAENEDGLAELALSLNLRRRHLDESQRALVAGRLARLMESPMGRPKKSNAHLHDFSRPPRFEAAETVNVSSRLVSSAIRVLSKGCEELIAAGESGAFSVSTAAELARLPEAEQKPVVAAGAKEAARKVRELRAGRAAVPAKQGGPVAMNIGVVVEHSSARQEVGGHKVVLLWVVPEGVEDAIRLLKAGGFCYAAEGG